MVKGPVSQKHLAMAACKTGNLRRESRARQEDLEEAQETPVCFKVGTTFPYLGRVIERGDADLAACIRNLGKARSKWGAISQLLQKDGASAITTARFYMVVVSAILLYSSEMWVITRRIEALLTAFHNRCAWTIGKTYIRKVVGTEDQWVYPKVAQSLKAAHLQPLRTYLDRRRVKFREYARERELYQRCERSASVVQPFPTLWDQLNNTTIDERNPELTSESELDSE